uniref:C2 domain-containing protein n=1 Tax=Pyrodinium bahamense TaxID=73915 RepID=A0A7R9ZVA3_9DINO
MAVCMFDCHSQPRGDPERTFGLNVLVHSVALHEWGGLSGILRSRRPSIHVSVGTERHTTRLGDWSNEKGQWQFHEALTVQVNAKDELVISIDAVGKRHLLVAEVLPRLRVNDRATDGLIYATPVMGFDVREAEQVAGRVFLSFETKTPWAMYRNEEDSVATMQGSDAAWEGPVDWRPGSVAATTVP